MSNNQQNGSVGVIVTIVLLSLALIGAGSFGAWAYMRSQDYKLNVDKKITVAVSNNTKKVQTDDAKAYAEEAQKPLKNYTGPEAFGSVSIEYPKTWSMYVASGSNSSIPVDLYANPDVVPAVMSQSSSFAFRLQVVTQTYDSIVKTFDNPQKQGKVTVHPYELPNNKGIIGSRIDGQIFQNKQGSMVILPLRDKTLKVWTESNDYKKQFDEIILANAHFSP